MGAHVTTNKPLATSKCFPYFSCTLSNTAAAFLDRSSLLKLTATNMADATKEASVKAASAAVTPAAVPASEVVTHIAKRMRIQTAPRFNTSFSRLPSAKEEH